MGHEGLLKNHRHSIEDNNESIVNLVRLTELMEAKLRGRFRCRV